MNNLQLLAGVTIPVLLAIVVAMFLNNGRFNSVEARIDSLDRHMEARFTSLEARLIALEGRIDHILEMVLRHDAILRGK